MKKKSVSLNIVIYPPEDILGRAVSISRRLKKKRFVLGRKKHFPHITLYMTAFPLKNVAKVKKLLKQLAANTNPFRINFLKYRQSDDSYIDAGYRKSKNVHELQRKVIGLLNPLREGLIRDKDKARMSQRSVAEQKNIRRYGYRSVGARYFPHMTFTKLEKYDRSALSRIEELDFSFTVTKIGLFYSGDHGTCRKLIAIYDF